MSQCDRELKTNLTPSNAAEVLLLASTLQLDSSQSLKKSCLNYIKHNSALAGTRRSPPVDALPTVSSITHIHIVTRHTLITPWQQWDSSFLAFFALLILVWQELKKCLERWCSSSLVQFSTTPNKAAKSSELSEQEYTDYDLPLALLSLLGQILQCCFSCSW